jgi:PadR family transcriptional regulator, regulatory protein PadR
MKTRTAPRPDQLALVQGTLDVLILRVLVFGAQHGQGIARAIQQSSNDELLVDHGALYPALQRLEAQRWITAKWGLSANNRRARFYTLTTAGKKQLGVEESRFSQMFGAIMRVMKTT